MNAAILSIGDELMLGQNLDTHARWMSEQLAAHGVAVLEHRTLPDDRRAIAATIAALAEAHDLLLITGGLGPTLDDLTRDALGDVFDPDAGLIEDEEAKAALEQWYRRRTMPVRNLVQALRPPRMRILENPNGTAPGLAGTYRGCMIFALPGPTREMYPMFERFVRPEIQGDGVAIITGSVHAWGLGESNAAERLGELAERGREPLVGTTVSGGIVTARIRGRGEPGPVRTAVDDAARRVAELWAPYAFGAGEETLAEVVVGQLRNAGRRAVTAESCTGGWIGRLLVDVPGSSDVYEGGWITYSNDMKTARLGVPASLLETHGAVSAPVAAAMARGAIERTGATAALSVTGVAGPGGGTADKPVGLVYIGVGLEPDRIDVRRFRFTGDRTAIRERSAMSALQLLRLALIGDPARLLWESDASA